MKRQEDRGTVLLSCKTRQKNRPPVFKNVKTIGKNAFNGCKKLKTITFKGANVTKIGKSAFKNIDKKVTFKCPKKKLAAYETLCRKAGAPEKSKFKK